MIRKHNERLLLVLVIGVAVLLIFACLLLFSDCGADEWVSSSPSYSEGFIGSDSTEKISGVHAAPEFRTGSYTMLSTVSSTEDYTDGSGKVMYTYTSTTKYTYALDVSVTDAGISCRYTFVSIYGAISENGALTIDIDTTNPSLRNDSTDAYYELIGKSFDVSADKLGNLLSISGIDAIIAENPDTEALLDESMLLGMAGDIFYPMPASIADGTSWTVSSYGLDNTYTARRLSDGRFGIDIAGEEYTLPDPVTDSYGYTTSYSSISPLTGTLWIDCSDRALQELSTRQRSEGTLADAEGYGMYFAITSTNSCVVSSADNN